MSPPTIAPAIESSPPRIRTGSAFRARKVRANCTPLRAPQRSPVTSATNPAVIHTMTQILCSEMPTDRAAWWSSATARSALPVRVLLKNTASTATSPAAIPEATRSNLLTFMPVRSMSQSIGSSVMPRSSARTFAPQVSWAMPSTKNDRPIVAMKSVICGWFTSGRSTTRSVRNASAAITARASATASQNGTPIEVNPTVVSAARNTIAPWAKLNTPEALKISTKPSATSEYITPASSPPISTSKKNCMLVRDAEVRVDHALVAAHLIGRAVCDLAAIIEHHHAVRQIHHHAHVVLDQHHRRAHLVIDVEDEAAHVLLLLEVH